MSKTITTTFVYPPIPNRHHVGFGATEEAAKADLIENYPND